MSTTTHNSNTKSLWSLFSVSALLLILGGLTLGFAQESQLVLPTAQDGFHHTSPVRPGWPERLLAGRRPESTQEAPRSDDFRPEVQ